MLEGGEVVEDLVPLHVGSHLGKHQLVVMHSARKGGDAQILDEHKRRFVPAAQGDAGKLKTVNREQAVKHGAGFCFSSSSVSLLVVQNVGDKGFKWKMENV